MAELVSADASPALTASPADAPTPIPNGPDALTDDSDVPNADNFLDVVVTSVDAAAPSVTQAIASSLSSSGLGAYSVEFVVTKGVASYCIQRPLYALFDVLGAIQAAAPKLQRTGEEHKEPPPLPEFPPKGNRNDATRYFVRLLTSWVDFNSKNVLYQVQVVNNNIMESATAAADALDEAVQAEKARDEERDAALSTALIVSPGSPPDASQPLGYSTYIPEAIAQQSWLLSAPINVAGHLASKLFGSQEETAVVSASRGQHGDALDSEARSLLEELNGLNMQLMERMESLEDSVARLTAERDQERSKTHMAIVEKENYANEVKAKEQELASIAGELQRIQREREAWREIQAERDALLEEKHRWAMVRTLMLQIGHYYYPPNRARPGGGCRVAMPRRVGLPLNNHLTGTSTRLEKIAREMAATKQQYEEQMQSWEQERLQLTQQLVKARGQRRVLVTEIRNMRTQTEGQIAVAMAEASEARMVNKRLKKQNELLLTQIRTLINEAEDNEQKLQEVRDELKEQRERDILQTPEIKDESAGEGGVRMLNLSVRSDSPSLESQPPNHNGHNAADSSEENREETTEEEEEESPVPYTLSEDDIALLNGRPPPSASMRPTYSSFPERREDTQTLSFSSSGSTASHANPYRARLVAFFEERDPDKLVEVDDMLANYKGVEESLFESLELKYSFMELNQRIAQAL
ncbi:hypothetical protein ON010_g9659 [Phytophthora cinnamomi]|nr:hypothetical protein ON010_g9659 [Phytophthora cinnamomi]